MERVQFTYITYISTSPNKVWNALLDPKITALYWQHENVSDWRPGSRWEHRQSGNNRKVVLVGKVIGSLPPNRLVLTWATPDEEEIDEKLSRVTFEIEPFRGVTRLKVIHDRLEASSEMLTGITDGWPKVLSSLKSLIETGKPLPTLWDEKHLPESGSRAQKYESSRA